MKRSLKQAVATRNRGRQAVRLATVTIATVATTASAGLAWAASATGTGRAHHRRAATPTRSHPVQRKHDRARDGERQRPQSDVPPPAGPATGSLTAPAQDTAPTTDPYAYAPAPDPYVPPVVSSGGS